MPQRQGARMKREPSSIWKTRRTTYWIETCLFKRTPRGTLRSSLRVQSFERALGLVVLAAMVGSANYGPIAALNRPTQSRERRFVADSRLKQTREKRSCFNIKRSTMPEYFRGEVRCLDGEPAPSSNTAQGAFVSIRS